jgi:hypothetical protein
MKRVCNLTIFLLIVFAFVISGTMHGAEKKGSRLQKITVKGDAVVFDVNNISTYIRNNGSFNRNPTTGNSGFEWRKGTGNTAIYASGLWLGGLINHQPHVAIAEYSYEFDAGPMGTGIDPTSDRYRIYKIRKGDNASNSADYRDWPVADGAPVDANGNPLIIGDMTIWCVFNDNNAALHVNQNTPPVGVEVQLTAFAFNRSDALGNAIYYRWKIINKGGHNVDSMYVCVWADPDLGDSGDDYDGCDTTLGLGYTYNGGAHDGVYGDAPPATGFDFLQGPLVPSSGDTAKFPNGRIVPNAKFLKMTSYLKYSNDQTDFGNPNTGQETYNYFRTFTRSGLVIYDENAVPPKPTKFMFSGDPNLDAGPTNDIETGDPGDRRFMMSSGPFTMAPGDTQEIVAGNFIAQGSDYHTSVTALKRADAAIQKAYELDFKLPPPPPTPDVRASTLIAADHADSLLGDTWFGLDQEVILSWGENDDSSSVIERTSTLDPIAFDGGATKSTYDFQGYVVYQFASKFGDNPRIVATYDLPGNIEPIFDYVFDSDVGQNVYRPVKFGNNKGIKRMVRITQDKYTGARLSNGKDYYFAVTSYSYNEESVPKTLESGLKILTVRPTKLPGVRINASFADTVRGAPIIHVSGNSEARIIPSVIDPSKLTGHTYQIQVDTTDGSKVGWELYDETLSHLFLLKSSNLGPGQDGNNFMWPEKDGIRWTVLDVDPSPNPGSCALIGDAWMQSTTWSNEGGPWVIDPTGNAAGIITLSSDLSNYLSHMDPVFSHTNRVSIEVRFGPTEHQKAYRMRRTGGVGTSYVIQSVNPFVDVPFTVWDVSGSTPRQLTVAWRDQDNSGTFNPPSSPITPGGASDGSEFVFIYGRTYNPDGHQWTYQGEGSDPAAWSDVNTVGENADIMYGMAFGLVDGTTPWVSSMLQVITYKALQANDVYTITGPTPPTRNIDLAKADIEKILAVPNPYFGASAYERNQFNRVVRFTNLPQQPQYAPVKIRIFNLAGELVRTIDKEDARTTADWDLTNKNDLPIASGMYIVHIDMPGLGIRVLKVAVIMSEERLDNF